MGLSHRDHVPRSRGKEVMGLSALFVITGDQDVGVQDPIQVELTE